MRQAAGLSGKHLAESLSWPASKVSKLENGRQTPTEDDIHAWTRATGAEPEAPGLVASLRTLEVQHQEWQRVLRTGIQPRQQAHIERDQRTTLVRAFEATVIPGLLQTAEYARHRIAEGIRRLSLPDDLDEAVAARVRRQEILYQPGKQFHFVITEAALRFRLCPDEVMLGQLDRLMSLAALPNVRLGIIGFDTPYTVSPWHGFWIHDTDRVLVETFTAGLDLRQPEEIRLYTEAFDELDATASYGRPARAIINRVIDDLAPDGD